MRQQVPATIGSDNGLSPIRPQAIIWTNAGILLIWPIWTNFSEKIIAIHTYHSRKSLWKCHLWFSSYFVSASVCQYDNSCVVLNIHSCNKTNLVLIRYLTGISMELMLLCFYEKNICHFHCIRISLLGIHCWYVWYWKHSFVHICNITFFSVAVVPKQAFYLMTVQGCAIRGKALPCHHITRLILGLRSANERWFYFVSMCYFQLSVVHHIGGMTTAEVWHVWAESGMWWERRVGWDGCYKADNCR